MPVCVSMSICMLFSPLLLLLIIGLSVISLVCRYGLYVCASGTWPTLSCSADPRLWLKILQILLTIKFALLSPLCRCVVHDCVSAP